MKAKFDKVSRVTAIWIFILGAWFLLAFVGGIDYLVTPWRLEHGIWFWISISMLIQIYGAAFVCWRRLQWNPFFVLPFTGGWLFVQYLAHWSSFLNGSKNLVKVEKYYAHFDTWYLIPQMSDRIVPDGYHLILSILLLICFIQGIRTLYFYVKTSST